MDHTKALNAVLLKSTESCASAGGIVKGIDFEAGMPLIETLLEAMRSTGFQATNVSLACDEINRMLSWRESEEAAKLRLGEGGAESHGSEREGCTIFLSFTSNMISSGVRETIKYLVKHKLVHVLVTSAGGVEEDLIKCLAATRLGDFKLDGRELRGQGVNRLGNLLIPNSNYCLFEDWVAPILHAMTDEQESSEGNEGKGEEEKVHWTPSKIIRRLGREIDNEESYLYWAYRNDIPVFCPALTDGSLGDMMYFHSYRRPEFRCDIIGDIRRINDIAMRAACTGMVILGGGVIKHHTCNANLMRNGSEFSVFVNTGQEFDGSDSGASPDEAISWGKIKVSAKPVKVYADATLVFPLIVSQTFFKYNEVKKRCETIEIEN